MQTILWQFIMLLLASCCSAQSQSKIKEMSHSQAMQVLLDTYKPSVEKAFHRILDTMPADEKQQLAAATLDFLPDETPFNFYKDGIDDNRVHVCLGGLNALDISASATATSILVVKDPSWWLRYLLYHRQLLHTKPGANWVDPLFIAGLSQSNTPEPLSLQLALFTENIRNDMVIFVVGHELAHVALHHNGLQTDHESPAEYIYRVRKQELEADHYALKIANRLGISPYAVVTTLLTHLLVYGVDRAEKSGSNHPEDNERMAQVVKFYRSLNDEKNDDFLKAAEPLTILFQNPDGVSTNQLLDAIALTVTLKDLEADAKRTGRAAK